MKDISVVVPVYRSTETLRIIVNQLSEVFSKANKSYEIVFVNDSPNYPPTSEVLSELAKNNSGIVRYIKMRKNLGQQFAIIVGFSIARGKYFVTMDDDLQHPPTEIIKMIEFIEENRFDAVLGIPKQGMKKHHWFRNFGSWGISIIDRLFLDTPEGIIKSPFRIINNSVAKSMVRNYNSTPSVSSLLFEMTHNVENMYVDHHPRTFGKSNYSIVKLFGLEFNNIIHYSAFPLKMFGIVGIITFLLSIIYIFVVLIAKLFFFIDFPGYASTVILISFFGGLNLFGLGIIGEYIFRIIKEQNKVYLEDIYIED